MLGAPPATTTATRIVIGLAVVVVAACSGPETTAPQRASTFTLPVMSNTALAPTLRANFAPAATLADAEAVQTMVNALPVRTRSILRSPFRSLDVALEDADDSSGLARLRRALEGSRSVERVEACPCPEEGVGAEKIQVGVALFKLQRSCGATTNPVPSSGCVSELEIIGENPLKGCAPHKMFVFDAMATQVAGQRVRRLKGRLSVAPPAEMVQWAPDVAGEVLLTPKNHIVTAELNGYYLSDPSYKEEIDFSPGHLMVWLYGDNVTWIATRPPPASTLPVRLEGATRVCVRDPEPAGGVERRYEVVAELDPT